MADAQDMTLACPVGHPSDAGHKACPLCGRKYVSQEEVVLPPTKEEALALARAVRRAAKNGEAVIPAARVAGESTTWTRTEVSTKLATVTLAATFVTALVMSEGVLAAMGAIS